MGMNNKVLGLIFASINDTNVIDLTKLRTMGSIPFGGRYRLIDFPLSNMVNSGISEVGVITKSNYGSLLDHLGSGREWDLTGKTGGLHLLPPFSHVGGGIYQGRLEALNNVREFATFPISFVLALLYIELPDKHRSMGEKNLFRNMQIILPSCIPHTFLVFSK